MKKQRFSLVELLVIVSIISVLVSILLPSMHKAREKAKTAVCKSNQKQIGLAISSYSSTFDDAIPPGYHNFFNLLVNNDYLVAPRGTPYSSPNINVTVNSGHSVLKCPNALTDRLTQNCLNGGWNFIDFDEQKKAHRTADMSLSGSGGIDSWYGINASSRSGGGTTPFVYNNFHVSDIDNDPWPKITGHVHPAQSVATHDGTNSLNTFAGNGGRISASHSFNKSTNVMFYDGHVVNVNHSVLLSTRTNDVTSGSDFIWLGYKH